MHLRRLGADEGCVLMQCSICPFVGRYPGEIRYCSDKLFRCNRFCTETTNALDEARKHGRHQMEEIAPRGPMGAPPTWYTAVAATFTEISTPTADYQSTTRKLSFPSSSNVDVVATGADVGEFHLQFADATFSSITYVNTLLTQWADGGQSEGTPTRIVYYNRTDPQYDAASYFGVPVYLYSSSVRFIMPTIGSSVVTFGCEVAPNALYDGGVTTGIPVTATFYDGTVTLGAITRTVTPALASGAAHALLFAASVSGGGITSVTLSTPAPAASYYGTYINVANIRVRLYGGALR